MLHYTRAGLRALSASRTCALWWLNTTALRPATAATISTPVTLGSDVAQSLPDAVVDAWLSWAKERGGKASTLLPSPANVLRVLPRVSDTEPQAPGNFNALCSSLGSTEESSPGGAAWSSCVDFGALCDSLHAFVCSSEVNIRTPVTLEAAFAQLCTFTPLFVRLDTASGHLAALLSYCDEAAGREDRAGNRVIMTHPYMQRLLRKVRVSWQPWVTPAQKARLIAVASASSPVRIGTSQVENPSQNAPVQHVQREGATSQATRTFHALSSGSCAGEQERCWRTLLESVPPFFVSAELVRADVIRRYPCDGERMFGEWVGRGDVARCAVAASQTSQEAEAVLPTGESTRSGLPHSCAGCAPYLEVTLDGLAVRAPSAAACLQSGCPARLIYERRPETCGLSPQERYSLVRNTHFGPELMHYAVSLLAGTVPTTPCYLDDARELFATRTRLHADATLATEDAPPGQTTHNSLTCAKCVSFFPCVEVLLDHPDLAFALQVQESASGFVRVGLPSPALRCASGPRRLTDNSFRVQLHPDFAHEWRGVADAALAARLHGGGDRGGTPHLRSDAASSTTPSSVHCCVHVHCLRSPADLAQPSLCPLLRRAGTAKADNGAAAAANVQGRGIVGLSCLERASGNEESASDRGQTLVVAFTDGPQRVDVVLINEPCFSILLERVVAASVTCQDAMQPNDAALGREGEDPPTLLNLCARFLCRGEMAKVFPARSFDGLPLRGLSRLWAAMPASALASVCSLTHVAHYAGYPMGSAMVTGPQADRVLSAVVMHRHQIRLDVVQWHGGESDLGEGGENGVVGETEEEVQNTASVTLAAFLLHRGRQMEESHSCWCSDTLINSTGPPLWAQNWPLEKFLAKLARSPTTMTSYGVALRLDRYAWWLHRVAETSGSFQTQKSRLLRAFGSGVARSPAAAQEALQTLIGAYGEEPLPDTSWVATLASDIREDHQLNSCAQSTPRGLTDTAAPASTQNLITKVLLTPETSASPLQDTPEDEVASLDACLYDALLRDAAALQSQEISSSDDSAGAHSRATTPSPRGDGDGPGNKAPLQDALPSPSSSPPQPPTEAIATDRQEQTDTLHFYLTSVLGGDANGTAVPTPPTEAQTAQKESGAAAVSSSLSPLAAHKDCVLVPPPCEASPMPNAPLRPPRGFLYGPQTPSRRVFDDAAEGARATSSPRGQGMSAAAHFCPPHWHSGQLTQREKCGSSGPSSTSLPTCTNAGDPSFLGAAATTTTTTALPLQPSRETPKAARFDPFAPWTGHRTGSSVFPFGVPPTAPSSPRDVASTYASPQPPRPPSPPLMPVAPMSSAALPSSHVTPSAAAIASSDFLGRVSDAERLRLASLLIDILRGGTPSPPSPPPP